MFFLFQIRKTFKSIEPCQIIFHWNMLKHNFPIVFFFLYGLIQQHGFFYDFSCLLWCFLYDFPTFFFAIENHVLLIFLRVFLCFFLWFSYGCPIIFPWFSQVLHVFPRKKPRKFRAVAEAATPLSIQPVPPSGPPPNGRRPLPGKAQEKGLGSCKSWDILVGGLEHQFYFPIYWVDNHPNWLIFFRGVQYILYRSENVEIYNISRYIYPRRQPPY